MKRYRLVASHHSSGGYIEFSALTDEDAVVYAESTLYGSRIVQLGEIKIGPTDIYRPIIPR